MASTLKGFEMVEIRGGAVVLAKRTKYGVQAATYANETQASRKAAELRAYGVACYVYQPRLGPVRYIRITNV